MQNDLIRQLESLLTEYGEDLPPIDARRPLWAAVTSINDAESLTEFRQYYLENGARIHPTLLGELGRIISDNPDVKM